MTRPVRYGILGTARIARTGHVPAARNCPVAEVLAVASRSAPRAKAFARDLAIPRAYGSYADLLADPDLDAVINVLPNSLHHEWTLKALAAGKHVLCEKPLAMTPAEAAQMFASARAAGRLLMEAFKHRFHPQLQFVRQQIADGAVGDVRTVRCELVYTIQDWNTDSRTFADLGGGCLMDAGCYCTSTVRYLLGDEPLAVQGMRRLHPRNHVNATFIGLLEFPGGRLAEVLSSMEQPFRACCEVVGSAGRIALSNLFGKSAVAITSAGKERIEEFDPPDLMIEQIEHFSRCILEGSAPEISAAESLGNAATLAALRRAVADSRRIALPATA